MAPTKARAAPGNGPPRDIQQAPQLAERQQQPTADHVAPHVAFRRRRDAAGRLPPLEDGSRDPLDVLADGPGRRIEWGGYDVVTLGLNCAHGDGCPAGDREAV